MDTKRTIRDKSFEEKKYDDNGNIIYYRDNYCEYTYEYDDNGNIIYYRDNYCKYTYEYDDNGNCIHRYDSEDKEKWMEYDDNLIIQ